jgi:quaternary ammonium compound-resistance protein SugE
MAWIYLLAASVGEILWTYTLKASEGFTRPWISIVNVTAMLVTAWLLALATKTMPLGTAYTIWTGFGIVGTVAVSVALFGEEMNLGKLVAMGLIVAGTIMLKFVEG